MPIESIEARPVDRPTQGTGLGFASFMSALIWLVFASSFIVRFEPSPTDVFFLLAFVLLLFGGLTFSATTLPILALLLLYNLGGLISLTGYLNDPEAVKFMVISIFMFLIFIGLLGYIIRGGTKAIRIIKSGWIVGALIGSVLGILGAIDAFGMGGIFSNQGRAMALFKDPNVFSTFLIYPAAVLFQRVLLNNHNRSFLLNLFVLFVIVAALFLAFSRGAWINFAFVIALISILTFATYQDAIVRLRILLVPAIALLLVPLIILVLLSVPTVRELFAERFSLSQNYDLGETGRFGNQLNSLPDLLRLPLGYGPLQFWKTHGQDPHNTFLNAFASYGWLGGLSYLAIVICSLAAGFRMVLRASPYQSDAIVVFATLLGLIMQGVQIDTEHWRHMFWLLALHWGIFALSEYAIVAQAQSADQN